MALTSRSLSCAALLTLSWAGLVGCKDPDAGRGDLTVDSGAGGDGGTDGGTDSDGDTDADTDGGDPVNDAFDITAELTDIQTVVRVRFSTEDSTAAQVEFGPDTSYGQMTAQTDSGTEHEVLLLGNPADTEIHFRVWTEGEPNSADYTITTGSLPSGLPALSVTGTATDWDWQVVPLQGAAYAVVIIDNQGQVVWYDPVESTGNLMRSFISHDRQWVVYCLAGPQDNLSIGKIVWVAIDGSERREVSFPMIDHDMVELPDGTIGAIVVTQGELDWAHKTADRIVELDADGNQHEIWSAWDTLDFDALGMRDSPEPNLTHGNGLDYVEAEDAYYISLKTLGSVAKVHRSTGETEWIINGRANQFTFPEGDEMVMLQHQFQVLDGALLVFDNGDPGRGYSRVVEIEIDPDTLQADNVWEYIRDPSVFVFAKGDVHRFDSGNTQVVWSASGEIQNVTPAGEVLWQLNTDLGQAITFVQVVDDLYVRD